jgi:hypothetical protein
MNFRDIFRPYARIKELEKENERLRDENDSVWEMMDEIKEAETDAIEALAIRSMPPAAEA